MTPTSARLNGTVTPNGQSTSWYFDYGTSTSYGTRTTVKSAGSGTRPTQVNASLTRLRAGVTYHFRLVATNASGTTVGRDRMFSTALQPVVRTDAARDLTATTATLTGSVDPRTEGDQLVVRVRHDDGLRLPDAVAKCGLGSARAVSAALWACGPARPTHYRLVARNDAGTSRSADASVTTVGVTLTVAALPVVYGRGILLSGAPCRRAARARP